MASAARLGPPQRRGSSHFIQQAEDTWRFYEAVACGEASRVEHTTRREGSRTPRFCRVEAAYARLRPPTP